jgi:integrase
MVVGLKRNQQDIVLSGPEYFRFINSVASPRTQKVYNRLLKKYMKYHGVVQVSDLLKNRKRAEKIFDQITRYIVDIRDTTSYGTRRLYLEQITSFYTANDVILNTKQLRKFLGQKKQVVRDGGREYKYEEIARLLEFCDYRAKVVVLLMASTGMRVEALVNLKKRHLQELKEYNLYQIIVYELSPEQYITFCTPECKMAIDAYLEYRNRCGEIITDDSPLIREQFDLTVPQQVKNPKHLKLEGINKIVQAALDKSGIRTIIVSEGPYKGNIRYEVQRNHGLRKFAVTKLSEANVEYDKRERMVGHKVGLDRPYNKIGPNVLLKEYLKAVDLLTINEQNRLRIKVEELSSKTKDNEYIIKLKLQEKDDQIRNMENQFTEMHSQIQTLISTLGSIDVSSKNEIAKQLIQKGMYKSADQNPETSKLI